MKQIKTLNSLQNPYKTFPLFWKTCVCCGDRFKFEFGWKYFIGQKHGWKYICKDCAIIRESAVRLINRHPHIPEKPKPPKF